MDLCKKGIAIIGCGRIGEVHLKNALGNRRAAVRWVVEADQLVDKTRDLMKTLEIEDKVKVAKFSDLENVLSDPLVDAVVVGTPTGTHEEICVAASRAGKAIFCEKPLAPNTASIARMYDAADKAGKPLFCALSRRFDPQLRRLHDLVKAGKVGQVRIVKSVSRDPRGMSTRAYLLGSGGIFVDSAVHDIDQLLWLVGETPDWVMATGSATNPLFKECDDVDTAAVMMKFPGGALGQIELSRETNIGYDQRLEVLGNEGLLTSENQQGTYLRSYLPEGVTSDPVLDDFQTRYRQAYVNEMDHFLKLLSGEEPTVVSRVSVEAVHKVCHACKLSHQTGEKVYISQM